MTDTLIKVLELLIAFFADIFHVPFLKGSGIESLIQEKYPPKLPCCLLRL
jgi:hypothetical protein